MKGAFSLQPGVHSVVLYNLWEYALVENNSKRLPEDLLSVCNALFLMGRLFSPLLPLLFLKGILCTQGRAMFLLWWCIHSINSSRIYTYICRYKHCGPHHKLSRKPPSFQLHDIDTPEILGLDPTNTHVDATLPTWMDPGSQRAPRPRRHELFSALYSSWHAYGYITLGMSMEQQEMQLERV